MPGNAPRGLLARLRRDVRGNTLAMMAMFLIPLTGLVGSAVDISRLYVVKARLQQACDAGALAGRKFMIDSTSSTLDTNAANQAQSFFANNFRKDNGPAGTLGYMNTSAVTFTPSKTTDNQVAGTASASVPLTISRVMATTQLLPASSAAITLNVSCEARYDIADTDVMFVLDNTGSMACLTSDGTAGCSQPVQTYPRPDGTTGYYVQEKSGSKLSGLRSAVLNFYDTVAANADPSTHVRYGFVTYTSTVNAGYAVTALSTNYMVQSWTYQSRYLVPNNSDATNGSSSTSTYNNVTTGTCTGYAGRTPATGFSTTGTATKYTVQNFAYNSGQSGPTGLGTCKITVQPLKPNWRYGPTPNPYDVSQFILGNTVDDPSKLSTATSKWQGCLEERNTTPNTLTFNVNSLPPDLDPDLVPTNDATRWRPMWPDVVYYRGSSASTLDDAGSISLPSTPPAPYIYGDFAYTGSSYIQSKTSAGAAINLQGGYVSCGKPVQRLAVLARSDVSAYVNASDFVPQGGTYHDTGMIWGTRLISPTGLFAGDTSAWPARNAPNRYIVFMTDGDMAPNAYIYGMYGVEQYDQRVSGGGSNLSNLITYHNARFQAECSAAKARNITVFVVGFGQSLTTDLTNCASPGQAYYASDNASLNTAFQTIAKQVAMLRISK